MDSVEDWSRYDTVLHSVYEAAVNPQHWPRAISEIAELWRAPRALLYSFSVPSGAVGFTFTHNISPRELQIYAARSANADPFVEAAQRKGVLSEGRAHLGHELVPREALVKTEFYRDIWAPLNIGQLCTGVIFDGTDAHKAPTALSLYRSFDDPPFTSLDRERLQRLIAHLSRALGVMFHLRDRELQVASTLSALDSLKSGVVLLDEGLGVVHRNGSAHALLDRGDPIGLRRRTLRSDERDVLALPARLRDHVREFDAWLSRANLLRMQEDVDHFSNAFVLPGAQGEPRCVLHASPLVASGSGLAGLDAPRVIVFIYDMAVANIQPQQLCDLFALTPAEARAALQVLVGGSAADMAARLNVSVNTLKTQLAGVYGKTLTHRQPDLLKLLLSLTPP